MSVVKIISESEPQMKIDELIEQIRNLTYRTRDGYELRVINAEHVTKVEQIIRQWLLDNHDAELGELKAKLGIYEQIIAKSNFAPLLHQNQDPICIDFNSRDKRRLCATIFLDTEPDEIAEQIYRICHPKKLNEVIEKLLEYKELSE